MPEERQRADQGETQHGYPAEKARQGEIILRTRARRIVFIAGLVGFGLLILLGGLLL